MICADTYVTEFVSDLPVDRFQQVYLYSVSYTINTNGNYIQMKYVCLK